VNEVKKQGPEVLDCELFASHKKAQLFELGFEFNFRIY